MSEARNRLRFERRGGVTSLVECRAELPLVVQRPLRGPDGQAVVVLLTPAGALFDGDDVHLRVECGAGTDVTLATAAATRLNRGQIGFELSVTVAAGGVFRYLPHELIPFRGARYRQRLMLALAAEARAACLEVVTPGRTDEPFAYACLAFDTQVRVEDRLVVREAFVLGEDVQARLDPFSHYGSLLLLDGAGTSATAHAASLAAWLSAQPVCAAASALPAAGVAVKMLGSSAQALRQTLLHAPGTPAWLPPLLPA